MTIDGKSIWDDKKSLGLMNLEQVLTPRLDQQMKTQIEEAVRRSKEKKSGAKRKK